MKIYTFCYKTSLNLLLNYYKVEENNISAVNIAFKIDVNMKLTISSFYCSYTINIFQVQPFIKESFLPFVALNITNQRK